MREAVTGIEELVIRAVRIGVEGTERDALGARGGFERGDRLAAEGGEELVVAGLDCGCGVGVS